MSGAEQELRGNNVVVVGNFAVRQAHPDALLKSELIRHDDLADLVIEAVVPDLVAIRFSWISLSVEPERITASTTLNSPMPEPVRDFVIGFAEDQENSPISAIGINTDYHFQAPTLERFHEIGHILAPKEPWGDLLKNPGMQSLSIRGERDDHFKGYRLVRVEPSIRLEQGIYISINDHYQVSPDQASKEPQCLLKVLETEWASSLRRAEHIIDSIKTVARA